MDKWQKMNKYENFIRLIPDEAKVELCDVINCSLRYWCDFYHGKLAHYVPESYCNRWEGTDEFKMMVFQKKYGQAKDVCK
jgi:hypothetical protein